MRSILFLTLPLLALAGCTSDQERTDCCNLQQANFNAAQAAKTETDPKALQAELLAIQGHCVATAQILGNPITTSSTAAAVAGATP